MQPLYPAGAGDQAEVIAFLSDPATHGGVAQVDRFETHGNLVFLAGPEAWKIKRAVRFPYMDFSTLEKRRSACEREVAINRRLAPEIYLGAVAITRGEDGKLGFGGGGAVVEWAVHMRRFEQSALLSSIAAREGISRDLAGAVADTVLESHRSAERGTGVSGSARVSALVRSLSQSLAASAVFDSQDVARFSSGAEAQLHGAAALLDERARQGFVRRCHGDAHLANIVLWQGRPVLFDAIEFDDEIATIDTLYDLAFLLMDLDTRRQRPAANIVLNRYLLHSNETLDLKGLAALPLFLALRAAVRAMVTADRSGQEDPAAAERDRERSRGQLRTALRYLAPRPAQLVAVGGLSGSGKSTLAAALASGLGPVPGAVHLRSDLERKVLFGVPETVRLPPEAYGLDAAKNVYGILCGKARTALAAGHSVVADAVYGKPEERQEIAATAADLGVPFHGLWLAADPRDLVARIDARRNDASDATAEIVAEQLTWDIGKLGPGWISVAAGGSVEETLSRARAAVPISNG